MNIYDIAYIGAGPSTMCSILELINNNYSGKICIIDKGNLLGVRDKKEVIYGYGGAGAYSDGKLTSSVTVGGILPDLTEEEWAKFEDYFLNQINIFKQKTKYKDSLVWSTTTAFDTKDSQLIWDIHRCCHMGTEVTQAIYYQMQEYLKNQPNITLLNNIDIVDIISVQDSCYNSCAYDMVDSKNNHYYSRKVVVATGRFGTLPSKLVKNFDLKTQTKPFSLGIRVEDTINPQYESIIKASYDFKFVKYYSFPNGIKVRVRTFCCNSGNAHTAAEHSKDGFISFNGHAFKKADPTNNTVNYGIVCETWGMDKYSTRDSLINLMKEVNNISTWKEDNFEDYEKDSKTPSPKRVLLAGFDHLKGVYPTEIIEALTDFVNRLNTLVDLSKAHYLYPEIKLGDNIPLTDPQTYETESEGLYLIGDCNTSNSIMKSSFEGYKLAINLKPNKNW